MPVGQWAGSGSGVTERRWAEDLVTLADPVVERRLTYLNLSSQYLGDPIDWHRDHEAGRASPIRFAPSIDYRDFRLAGDCKHVWEPNRHHHLVILGRAYRATGDVRYAEAVAEQLGSWLEQNPFGIGMNWRSPLELGIRLINWVWALDLIGESNVVGGEFRTAVLNSVFRHVWEVARKFSRGSSSNNHLIGEAAGVFVATSYFHRLRNAARWRGRAGQILSEEILRQTFPDGGGSEQAVGYHLFILQFFVISGLVARQAGQDFPASYWSRLEKMFEFLAAMTEGGQDLPMFGDADDGYVLDLSGRPRDARGWLCVGATLFGRPDFKTLAGEYSETARWLLGGSSREQFDRLQPEGDGRLVSRAFPDSGYYLLQYGRRASSDSVSLVFDCGPLGMGALAGHGHADALSFTLRISGRGVLVDPGTYDYFAYPQWRAYFRSTRAHNTVVVDGQDQSEMLGPFLWGRKAAARCLEWRPSDRGGEVVGEHDGYTRLRDAVVHRRTLLLDGPARRLLVRDEIQARRRHRLEVFFHLAEDCEVRRIAGNRVAVETGAGVATITLDPSLSVRALRGSEDPICGWVSRGYHQKQPSTTIVGRCDSDGPLTMTHTIELGEP